MAPKPQLHMFDSQLKAKSSCGMETLVTLHKNTAKSEKYIEIEKVRIPTKNIVFNVERMSCQPKNNVGSMLKQCHFNLKPTLLRG